MLTCYSNGKKTVGESLSDERGGIYPIHRALN